MKPGMATKTRFLPASASFLQRLVRVRLQPLLAAEQRLKRLRPLGPRPAESLDEAERRPLDLRRVRIAPSAILDRDAVEAEDMMVRLPGQFRQLVRMTSTIASR